MATMLRRVAEVVDGSASQLIWLLEHPSIYTAGSMADDSDLIDRTRFPIYKTDRGGKYTYHGPGQRVIYLILDLALLHNNKPDLRLFINQIEQWLIRSFAKIGIVGITDRENVGIWVQHMGEHRKIASIGLRIKKWVTYHGIAINISTNLEHYSGIIPCGLKGINSTSLRDMKCTIDTTQFDTIILYEFSACFNVILDEINEIS